MAKCYRHGTLCVVCLVDRLYGEKVKLILFAHTLLLSISCSTRSFSNRFIATNSSIVFKILFQLN
jgi:hypothetical protein